VIQLVAQNGRMIVALDALGRPVDSIAAVAAADTRAMPLSGLAPGTRAPEFSLRDITGRAVPLTEFRGLPTLLVFSDPQCGPCNALLPTIGQWQSQLRDRLRVVLVSSGSIEANRAKSDVHALSHVLLQEQQEVQTLFAAYGTPSAVLIGPDGAIASRVAQGRDAILGLVSSFAEPVRSPVQRQPSPPVTALPVGTAAPTRPLLDLFGQQADIAYSRSKATLLLFWNPACGYCQKMLPDLQTWAMRNSSACDLVVVSTGSPEANLALGLPATILLDHDFALGRDFNVQGTPSAIVVASDGTVKSALAVGGNAVMALARASASSAAA
jgi:thiol-disulfide isomerase/thioredoxin